MVLNINDKVKIINKESKYYNYEGKVCSVSNNLQVVVDIVKEGKLTFNTFDVEKYFIVGDVVKTIHNNYGVVQSIKYDNYCKKTIYCVGLLDYSELKVEMYTVEELKLAAEDKIPTTPNKNVMTLPSPVPLKNITTKYEMVDHPQHYHPGDYEAIKVIEAWLGKEGCYSFCLGNAMKYISRLDNKPSADKSKDEKTIEDIEKTIWYLEYAKKMKTSY